MRSDELGLEACLATETSARRKAEDALDLRNAALDAATTHFMIVDMRNECREIVYVNRALALAHGYEHPQELIGQDASVLLAEGIDASFRDVIRQALIEGLPARVEIEFTRRGGSKFLCGVAFAPLRDAHGLLTHYVALGADITQRKEDERRETGLREQLLEEMRVRERMSTELRLAQKLESVGRLASGLAHEINTPIQYVSDSVHFLTSACRDIESVLDAHRLALATSTGEPDEHERSKLQAMEEALDMDFLRAEVPKALERTLEGVDRVAAIVRAMKEFAYPDRAEHAPADVNRALTTTLVIALNEYKYLASVTTEFGDLPPVVCNIGELNQVFLNLIVNAAHAIQDSGQNVATGRIVVKTCAKGDIVEVSVCDNGCGIDAAAAEKVFDPFYTTKEVGRGTGQGLAIARSIVIDKHGGRIAFEGAPGGGTRFIVALHVNGKPAPT